MAPECTIDDSWERRWGTPEWEHQSMTICIAAMCDHGHALVLAADREIGITYTSAELDGKFLQLTANWYTGFAGEVSHATDVIAASRRIAKAEEEPSAGVTPTSLPMLTSYDMRSTLARAYQEARMQHIEGQILASRGWTLQEFKDFGSAKLPITTYSRLDTEISQLNFGTSLLVAGFGSEDQGPSIFSVRNPGYCEDHSKLAFWSVGTGAQAAQMSLFNRAFSWQVSPEAAAFYLYEAKMNAQRATGVGLTTDIFLIRKNSRPIQLRKPTMDTLEGSGEN
jgi:hypothetical protein